MVNGLHADWCVKWKIYHFPLGHWIRIMSVLLVSFPRFRQFNFLFIHSFIYFVNETLWSCAVVLSPSIMYQHYHNNHKKKSKTLCFVCGFYSVFLFETIVVNVSYQPSPQFWYSFQFYRFFYKTRILNHTSKIVKYHSIIDVLIENFRIRGRYFIDCCVPQIQIII